MLQYNMLYIKHITGERGSMLNFIRGFCMALADSVPGCIWWNGCVLTWFL